MRDALELVAAMAVAFVVIMMVVALAPVPDHRDNDARAAYPAAIAK